MSLSPRLIAPDKRGEDADLADCAGLGEPESRADGHDQSGQQQAEQAGDDRVEADRVDQARHGLRLRGVVLVLAANRNVELRI